MVRGVDYSDASFLSEMRALAQGDTAPVALTLIDVELEREGATLAVPAPNAIEWCVGKDWCNSPSLFEYYRSYQIIRDYFELRCPNCNDGGTEPGEPGDPWNKSRDYLESETLLVWDADNFEDTCPKCGVTKSELVEDGLSHGYNQLHLVCGMRAGKSMTAALIGTYVEHRLLTIAHGHAGGIHGYFDITPAEKFEITFLAANQVQSEDTIWAKYTGFRSNSPWFQRYVPWIRRVEKAQPKTGMKLWRYDEGTKKIINEYPRARLVINALNTNSGGQAGRTRLAGVVDELARMNQTEGRQGADEIYRTIEASLRTARSRTKLYGGLPWIGSMISVTSPVARDDKSMRLLRKAPEVRDMLARHYPTWQFNPKEPRRNFDSEYAKDPVGAERDFGANPPGAEHPLVHDERRWVELCVEPKAKPIVDFEYFERRDGTGHEYVGVRISRAPSIFDSRPRFVAFDGGQNFDAFSGACAHFDVIRDDEGRERKVTVVDFVIRILPLVGTEVYFRSVVDVITALKRVVPVARVEFDRWQSVQIIQDVRDLGIAAEAYSLKNQDFETWRAECYDGNFQTFGPIQGEDVDDLDVIPYRWKVEPPYLSPQAAAIYELFGLQQDPDTKAVTNPHKGARRGWNSDDTARVLVHVDRMTKQAGFTERYDDRSRRARRRRAEEGGANYRDGGSIARPHAMSSGPRVSRTTRRGW